MTTTETAAAPAAAAPARAPGRSLLAGLRTRAGVIENAAVAVFLVALVAASLVLHARTLGLSFWIDEGLSVGISSHGLAQIPSVLQQDGSPPLYYMLLHVWMAVFGKGVEATHVLSLIFALLCVPAALWAGWSLFGRSAGLIAATLAALNPFLTGYSTETRMYTLIVLLGILATAAFLHAFVFRRRRYVPAFALTQVLLLYTHNWTAFLAFGFAVVALVLLILSRERRRLAIDAAVAAAIVIVLYAPWVPTLIFQLRHTGAPWSPPSTWRASTQIPQGMFGGGSTTWLLLAAVLVGVVLALARPARRLEPRAIAAITAVLALTVLAAWTASKISPAWATRYFATFLGPALLVVAVALTRARWLGLLVLVVVALPWLTPYRPSRDAKSNARPLAARLAPFLHHGDLVLVTHPEQVPVLHYYLPAGFRYATELGPDSDPGVMDWRDALEKLRAAQPATKLRPLVDALPAGRRVALVLPVLHSSSFNAPWTRLMRRRALQWKAAMAHDPHVRLLSRQPGLTRRGSRGTRLYALVYVRTTKS